MYAVNAVAASDDSAAADKNEQNASSTRRLRRTPRPTEELPEQQPEKEREKELVEVEQSQEQLTESQEQQTDVKKEPEKLSIEPPVKRGRGRAKKIRPEAEQQPPPPPQQEGAEESERKVGRKRKLAEEELQLNELQIKTEQEEDATPSGSSSSGDAKRMRRSVRLGNRTDAGQQWPEDVKLEPAALPPPAAAELAPTLLDEKTPPKKRGRKAKIQVPPVEAAAAAATQSVGVGMPMGVAVSLTNGNKPRATLEQPLPKRSKRRIKPTPKILENDELRCEFETKHIERMAQWEAAEECEEAAAATAAALTPTSSHCSASRQKSEKSESSLDHAHPAGSAAIKKRLLFKSQRDIDNSDAALLAKSLQPACPDFEQFMSEIKADKLNANRSPEERKLNKKQQRKLAKQKEKHLKQLGLRRKNAELASENDSSNTDNEEFVPTTRVHVGKPSVTLRLRNAAKELQAAAAAATPTPKLTRKAKAAQQDQQDAVPSTSAAAAAAAANSAAAITTTAGTRARAGHKEFICLCQQSSQYYARNAPDSSYCCAIDNIDEQKIGCCNELASEVHNLLRPSQRVGYMILCDDHKKRLQSHNCCAGCGIFCTQGKFMLCKQQHFFHPDCAQRFILNSPYETPTTTTTTAAATSTTTTTTTSAAAAAAAASNANASNNFASPLLVLKCPHCGLDTPERTSTVTMKCQSLPVFLPAQKTKIKPAKLTTSAHLSQLANRSGVAGKTRSKTGSLKANGTRPAKSNSSSAGGSSSIPFEQLIPESVMNVVLRGHIVSSSGRVTTEFSSRDMYYAVQNDDLERVAEILAADYNVLQRMREFLNGTCLHLVAHSGTLQMAYLLLCKGASLQNFVNIVDSELRTALMCAVMNEKCDMLNLFLQCGADVAIKGPDGMTSLHIAAKLGSLEAAQLIVDSYRSSQNIANFLSLIDAQDEGGWTAMVWAAELGHTDIVSLLINHGANPNICDNDNNTVLHWSTLHNDGLETITVLLQAGADCNVQNVEGDTPLHIACRHSVTRMCIALIANGADLMIKNRHEQLPFDCIPNEESECGRIVGFNMQMRSFRPLGLRTRVVCADASNGRELRPIQAVRNELIMSEHEDEADALMWPDFKYITTCIIQQNSVQIDRRVSQMRICSCLDSCSSDACQCNGASSQNWYTAESRLNCDFNYDDPAVIFECNDVCGCNQLSCKNRVVQNGIRVPLQIVECEETSKGWGVRALANVPKGSFVACYTGEILTAPEADRRTDDSYYFDLNNGHCIDANYYGNISRFFNHSCEPNILAVRVFYEHQDYRFPKIAFFACRDIDAGEEICYDYGDKFWRAEQRSGCKCLTDSCKYALHPESSNPSPDNATEPTSTTNEERSFEGFSNDVQQHHI
ncbi:histone-lysine N-methyltransferase EHMT2 [Drosophila busckii]|uniref:histone-lysine N-methyltransferase EHMT2 n=1 Tax=Drosophila busckii TaxID=30019 RepID=UPI00083EADE3|nr:histone-lysine N-methyltransferase EHMT2 [Drosophila busckii]